MKNYYILTYEAGSPHSESISKALLVSKNEKALKSIARRLGVFCQESQSFAVNSIIGNLIENNEYTVVREEICDFDYYLCEDLYEQEGLIDLDNLTADQEIIKVPVVNNYSKEVITNISTELFGKFFIRNDYQKAISYWNKIKYDRFSHSLFHNF